METAQERLPFRTKIAYGIGEMGELVFLGMFNGFIVIFYNQAVGLSNTLIGTAIMLAMIGDAISDPLVGMISDRWRSRFGRRHPFLFAAPIPLAISLFFIFNPPQLLTGGASGEPNQMWLFAWLACWTISGRLFVTLYTIPHHALGGELTKDHNERSQLFSMNAIIGYVSGACRERSTAMSSAFGFIRRSDHVHRSCSRAAILRTIYSSQAYRDSG